MDGVVGRRVHACGVAGVDQGLEPLAKYLWEQVAGNQPLGELAETFVDAEKGVESVDDALAGARNIIAEWVSENADFRKVIRNAEFRYRY